MARNDSSSFNSFSRSKINSQPQSTVGSTSHLPLRYPPQGPLSRPLEQRGIGQIPPVRSSTHSPQPRQRSAHHPGSSVTPMNFVSSSGKTRRCGKVSASNCTPQPQPLEKTAPAASTSAASGKRNSLSHWRGTGASPPPV